MCAGGTLLLPVSNQSGGHRQDILSHRAWSQAPHRGVRPLTAGGGRFIAAPVRPSGHSRPSDQDRKQGPALLSGSQRASSRSSTCCFAGRVRRPHQKVRRPHRVSFPGLCGIMKTCKAVKDKVTLELTAPGAKVPTSIRFWPSLDPDSPQGLELRRARAGSHVSRPPSEVLYHFPARGLYVHFARSHVPSCRG